VRSRGKAGDNFKCLPIANITETTVMPFLIEVTGRLLEKIKC
jgi:hypothetical protein